MTVTSIAAHTSDAARASDPSWSHVLLVEGTSGVGKSTLIDRLLRRYVSQQDERRLRTILHLTQAHTYGPLAPDEDTGTLTVEQNRAHLDDVVSVLEWHVRALCAEHKVKFLAIVDTLHLTQCHRPGVLTWSDVEPFDQRLAHLGARLVFLHGEPETLWTQGIVRRQHEEFMTDYANPRFGPSLEAIHSHFVKEQAGMRQMVTRSALPSLELSVESGDAAVHSAYRLWLD